MFYLLVDFGVAVLAAIVLQLINPPMQITLSQQTNRLIDNSAIHSSK